MAQRSESTEGYIVRVKSHKPSKYSRTGMPYLVALLDTGETVMGEMAKPERAEADITDERYRFFGARQADRLDPGATVFRFDQFEILIDASANGMAEYLSRHIDGIGKSKAKSLVTAFGADTIQILRTEPARAAEVPGITGELAEAIRKHFEEEVRFDPVAYAKLIAMLADFKVPHKLIGNLLRDWGSNAPEVIREHPYRLLRYPRMGWDTVDAFAMQVAQYEAKGVDRQEAAILEALARATDEGHTITTKMEVEGIAFDLIRSRPDDSTWAALIDDRRIALSDNQESVGVSFAMETRIAPPKLDAAERYIAARLRLLAAHARKLTVDVDAIEDLSPAQRDAIRLNVERGVSVLIGHPGVGKTWTLSRYIKYIYQSGIRGIRIMAPTGQAAKKAKQMVREVMGGLGEEIPSTTIHKALGIGPSDDDEDVPEDSAKVGRGRKQFGFQHSEDNPLEGQVFIIEEVSMVDVCLFAAVLAAIPIGSTVFIVGDPEQLPSVGPGSVLRDLRDGGVPMALLTEILRSDGGGTIVRACHSIRAGRRPVPAQKLSLPTDNWIHIPAATPAAIQETVVGLVAKVQAGSRLNLDVIWDVQVVSAQYKVPFFGCNDLNDRLSFQLNRRATQLTGDGDDLRFRAGDKVIRRKNGIVDEMISFHADGLERPDWTWSHPETHEGDEWMFRETTVVNGDIGICEDVVTSAKGAWAVVRFINPDRLCRLPIGKCHLQRAYATTVHSVQGSGYKYVIIPVHKSFMFNAYKGFGIWCCELFDTALSRAEMIAITVGDEDAIWLACGRRTLYGRKTRLVQRLREEAARPAPVLPSPEDVDFGAEETEAPEATSAPAGELVAEEPAEEPTGTVWLESSSYFVARPSGEETTPARPVWYAEALAEIEAGDTGESEEVGEADADDRVALADDADGPEEELEVAQDGRPGPAASRGGRYDFELPF